MLRRLLFLLPGMVFCLSSFGQLQVNEVDALRFSQTGLFGSARVMGMGGAYSAVGADLSSAHLNPAGLGVFRSSTFAITPSIQLTNSNSSFIDAGQIGTTTYAGIPSMGAAFTTTNYYNTGDAEKKDGLKSYTFAIGYNQVENYKRNAVVQGAFNEFSSITNQFAEDATGNRISELSQTPPYTALAYEIFMIDLIQDRADTTTYFGAAEDGLVEQNVQYQEEGRRTEWYFAFAGNVKDKLYFGLSLGLESMFFDQDFNVEEVDRENIYEVYDPLENNGFPLEIPFERLNVNYTSTTRGTGFNLNAGLIYRPSDALRIGFSAKTPTYFQLNQQFDATLTTNLVLDPSIGTEEFSMQPPAEGEFRYILITPLKLTTGLMYLFGKTGFLTADVDFINYPSAQLSSQEAGINEPGFYSFTEENQAIQNDFRSAINVRLGGELRFDMFRFRAGAGLQGTALQEAQTRYTDDVDLQSIRQIDNNRLNLTVGAGIRQPNFSLDVSIINQRQQDKLNPYTLSEEGAFVPTFVSTTNRTSLSATLGFYF